MSRSSRLPISVKGIVFEDGQVWLRKNERNEWELPGGKMDPGEQPEETVVRELKEELGLETKVIDIVQAYLYEIKTSKDESKGVLVVTYLCRLIKRVGDFEIEGEAGRRLTGVPPKCCRTGGIWTGRLVYQRKPQKSAVKDNRDRSRTAAYRGVLVVEASVVQGAFSGFKPAGTFS